VPHIIDFECVFGSFFFLRHGSHFAAVTCRAGTDYSLCDTCQSAKVDQQVQSWMVEGQFQEAESEEVILEAKDAV
jgi:hypothetical protein